jgi:lysophospholipase L1-like esterase
VRGEEYTTMKEIMCFGDSNTWGYRVIEEGLNGRTTVWDDPIELYKNGSIHLPPLLETHRPLDLVIIALGTNDLKSKFSVTAYDIAKSVSTLVTIVKTSGSGRNGGVPEILMVAPPPLGRLSEYAEMFTGGPEKSKGFAKRYREFADEQEVHFFDSSTVVRTSDIDGVHLEKGEHAKLGRALAEVVRKIL